MAYRRIDLEPGTPAWHEWRAQGIGASLAPIIMSESPYTTARELAERILEERRTGASGGDEPNYAMTLGSKRESEVRDIVSNTLGVKFETACLESIDNPVLRASLDGFNEDLSIILEIKLVGRSEFNWVSKNQKVLTKHEAQIRQQCAVADPKFCYYAVFTIDREYSVCITQVDRDLDAEQAVLTKVIEFWENLAQGKLPPETDRDYAQIKDLETLWLAEEYQSLKRVIKSAQFELDEITAKLWEHVGDKKRARCGPLKFQKIERKGAINYKGIEQLKNVDLEAYRAPSTFYRAISEVGDNEQTED